MRALREGDVYQHETILSYIFTVIEWNEETQTCHLWWSDDGKVLKYTLDVINTSIKSEPYLFLAGF